MIPVIFINCKSAPFVDDIIHGRKTYETRTRNTLGRLIGERVLLAETGNGIPFVKCSAVIDKVVTVHNKELWDYMRKYLHSVPVGNEYDWKPETKIKWLYHLTDVHPVDPFRLPSSAVRHGRVWAEYEGSEEK